MDVDWLRVSMACNGTPLQLNRLEQRMVLRRLAHKIPPMGEHPRPGRLTAMDIGRRIGMSDRHVFRIITEFEGDIESRCPVCREAMWIVDGLIEEHPDTLCIPCPLSGHPDPGQDWESWAALTVKWLAQRLRAGDSYGVHRYIQSVNAEELLMVALAAVDAEKPVEELFAWVEEVA